MKDFETENLKIRKFKLEDANDVHENLATEERLTKCLGYHIHKDVEETKIMVKSFIKEYEMNEYIWAIEEKDSNIVIGYLRASEISKSNKLCKIKFGIGLKWLDTGYMEEALNCILNYLFEEGFNIIITEFCDGHEELTKIKEKILKNVWMKKEASLSNRRINKKTKLSENLIIYSIMKEEFEEKLQNK